VEYGESCALQEELATLRAASRIPDTLLLLEHPPTITLGKRADANDILVDRRRLEALGVAVHETDRGGEITYHGPGQLVGYPICDLNDRERDLHRFLRDLEGALIELLAELGLEGRRFPLHTGVWVGQRKIAAIGIKVRRWVTTHGFALNVDLDLSHFGLIVPCGIRDFGVTSLAAEGVAGASVEKLLYQSAAAVRHVFDSDAHDDTAVDDLLTGRSAELWNAGKRL
jgi:lipoyl(octanoyl) transferase